MNDPAPIESAAQRVRLRVEDYLLLDDTGAFDRGRRTELLEGDVYYMSPQHRPHARITSRLFRAIADALAEMAGTDGGGLEAILGPSIAIPPHNAPEPDIVITNAAEGDGLMPLSSVRLVIEVDDATLRSDMTLKAAIYADGGIAEYWVVDVDRLRLHQFWSPQKGAYRETHATALGGRIVARTVAGLAVETDGI